MTPDSVDKLLHDVVTVARYIRVPFRDFLDEDQLYTLVSTRDRSVVSRVLKANWDNIDKRIRFVAAHSSGPPDGTIKLFDAERALKTPSGSRIDKLLNGGIVAFTTIKIGTPDEWYISGVYDFMPEQTLESVENSLDKLLQHFAKRDQGMSYPVHSIGIFEIRTGPSGYWVYLKAKEYFSKST
jgi:hypothetical protein